MCYVFSNFSKNNLFLYLNTSCIIYFSYSIFPLFFFNLLNFIFFFLLMFVSLCQYSPWINYFTKIIPSSLVITRLHVLIICNPVIYRLYMLLLILFGVTILDGLICYYLCICSPPLSLSVLWTYHLFILILYLFTVFCNIFGQFILWCPYSQFLFPSFT